MTTLTKLVAGLFLLPVMLLGLSVTFADDPIGSIIIEDDVCGLVGGTSCIIIEDDVCGLVGERACIIIEDDICGLVGATECFIIEDDVSGF